MTDIAAMSKLEFFKWLGYVPHAGQAEMHNSKARYRLMACGTRWGKSLSAAMEILNAMRIPDSRYWIVAPTYDLTEKVFRVLHATAVTSKLNKYIEKESYTEKYLKLMWDSEVKGKTAENPISLAGEELDGVAFDEGPACKEDIWTFYVRERLTDRKGWALFIGTPKGRNWYYKMFLKGKDPLQKQYESWHFTTYDNPYIDNEEIEAAKSELPGRAFDQEYMAIFLSEADAVFRNIREAITPNCLEPPKSEHIYVGGMDLGKYQDYNVLTIADYSNNQIVYYDRWYRTDWTLTYDRVAAALRRYNGATIWVDSTGIGDPIYETLSKAPYNLRVKSYKFTNQTKEHLIDNLAWFFENRQLKIPDVPEMINELEIFEYKITGTGKYTFNAPVSYHDDIVISLGLTALGLQRESEVYFGEIDLTKI